MKDDRDIAQAAHGACPECGRIDALVPLGTRTDRPQRRLAFGTRTQQTTIYACRLCDAVVLMPVASPPRTMNVIGRARHRFV